MMWNSEWEYRNQETLKAWYEEKISGKNLIWQYAKSSAKAVAESFIHRSKPRNIVCTLSAEIMDIKRN